MQDAPKMIDFIGKALASGICATFGVPTFGVHNKANTGVRWVHITTRNETPRKCARQDNKYQ